MQRLEEFSHMYCPRLVPQTPEKEPFFFPKHGIVTDQMPPVLFVSGESLRPTKTSRQPACSLWLRRNNTIKTKQAIPEVSDHWAGRCCPETAGAAHLVECLPGLHEASQHKLGVERTPGTPALSKVILSYIRNSKPFRKPETLPQKTNRAW